MRSLAGPALLALLALAGCPHSDDPQFPDGDGSGVDGPVPDAVLLDGPPPDGLFFPDGPPDGAPFDSLPWDAPPPDAPGPIDAPAMDAPLPDAPPGMAFLTVRQSGNGAGWLKLTQGLAELGECKVRECTFTVPLGASVTTYVDRGFHSSIGPWTEGCTGFATACVLTVDGPTTVTRELYTIDLAWVRTSLVARQVDDLAVTPTGVLAVGQSLGGAAWLGRYALDGTELSQLTIGDGTRATRVVADATGAYTVAVVGGPATGLRHHGSSGALLWTVPVVADDLDVDASGNLYVRAGAELVSYSAAGVERWRRMPPGLGRGVDVNRTGTRVAAGTAVYDLAGNLQWSYTPPASAEIASVLDVALDADGRVVYLFRNTSGECTIHTVAGANAPWPPSPTDDCDDGSLELLANDVPAYLLRDGASIAYRGPTPQPAYDGLELPGWGVAADGTQYTGLYAANELVVTINRSLAQAP